jgi:hypothetical protein
MDMSSATEYGQSAVPSASAGSYSDARAHELRARYLATFGGDEIPVPVRSIAEDLLGLRVEESWGLGECSGMLLPAERVIRLNAEERLAGRNDPPLRRHRFTIAHELGHWICHALGTPKPQATYCRAKDMANDTDRALEREANIFAAELLMPEPAVRAVWAEIGNGSTSDRRDQTIAEAARRFDVSPSAMWWRLYSYGCVPERPAVEGR